MNEFYFRVLDSNGTLDLEIIVWLVLIMPNGNANVESGFSKNNGILSENILVELPLKESSVKGSIRLGPQIISHQKC